MKFKEEWLSSSNSETGLPDGLSRASTTKLTIENTELCSNNTVSVLKKNN